MKRVFLAGVVILLLGGAIACSPTAEPEAEPVEPGLENGSFFADLNGFQIHYEVWGQGPVVMTVPNSWGLTLEGLRALYQPLEDKVTMVYFDPRGMGESAAIRERSDMGLVAVRDDFHSLRSHLGLEKVHALGWSNGAMNLIDLAAGRPEALDTAIFLHGVASYTEEDNQRWAEAHPDLMEDFNTFLAEMADETLTTEVRTARLRSLWIEQFFPLMFADQDAGRAKLQEMYAETEFSWDHFIYSNEEAPLFDGHDQLPLISSRCLVIAGAHDMLPPDKAEELANGLADSRYELFENSGHFAPVEEPDRFREVFLSFLGIED